MASGSIKKDFQIDNGVTSNPTSVSANTTAHWDVTFSKPFSVIPSVNVSVVTGSPLLRNAGIFDVSTTGFTVYVTNNSSTAAADILKIHWIAVAS